MTRWLVTGAGGMLGTDLVDVLRARNADLTAVTRTDLDITDPAACAAAVKGHDVVVNAAAWAKVDLAEKHEDEATAVNGTGVENLAHACAATGARMLHVSTDYVFHGDFHGDATEPYPEDAPTDPVNAYGRSKLEGEKAIWRLLPDTGYVVRTAWLYGAHGRNFVTRMLELAREKDTLTVVDDQRGQPTWTYALAGLLADLGQRAVDGRAPAGAYHGTASGVTTWYGFARAIFTEAGLDPDRIRPITTAEFPTPARRPAYSVLAHGRWRAAGLDPLLDWRAMLSQAFKRHWRTGG
jgi:dTDP-4-dehydrorhamnose reductase